MTTSTIYDRLTEILIDLFDDEMIVAQPDLTADRVAGWDSFAQIRLIIAVEKSFKVKFAAAEVANLKNVGALASLIENKIAA